MSNEKIILIIFSILIVIGCHAKEPDFLSGKVYNYRDEITWSFFNNEVEEIDANGNIETLKYQIVDKGYCHQLVLTKSGLKYEYLMLYHEDFLLLYDNKQEAPLYDGFFGKNAFLFFSPAPSINADSFLTEGKILYESKNLLDLSIGKPWVEGKSDNGIGSIITASSKKQIKSIIISNGFFSRKENLYYDNNRVKKIRIYNTNNEEQFMDCILSDTAKPFEVILDFETKDVTLLISEVYPGKKYNDTCLNFILIKTRL